MQRAGEAQTPGGPSRRVEGAGGGRGRPGCGGDVVAPSLRSDVGVSRSGLTGNGQAACSGADPTVISSPEQRLFIKPSARFRERERARFSRAKPQHPQEAARRGSVHACARPHLEMATGSRSVACCRQRRCWRRVTVASKVFQNALEPVCFRGSTHWSGI